MNKPGYFPQLTGIRAIAAYMVFIHHNVDYLDKSTFPTLYAMLRELHIGVTVFFVLSGFLIAYRYMDKVEVSKAWLYQYFKNRVARIYPMYFILTTCAFLFKYHHNDPTATMRIYLLNITFLRGFFNDYVFTGLAQGWSLTVEECFYALAPLIFLLRKRINIWAMALFLLGIAFAFSVIFKGTHFHMFFGSPLFVFTYTFFGRCLEFFIGIQLALIIRRRTYTEKKGFAYTLTGVAGIILCLYAYTFFPMSKDFNIDNNVIVRIVINNVICASFISILFYGLITELSVFRTFLATPVMKLLGESSYIFYLIHFGFVFDLLYPFVAGFSSRLPILFISITLMSILLYKFVEHPVNKYIREHFN